MSRQGHDVAFDLAGAQTGVDLGGLVVALAVAGEGQFDEFRVLARLVKGHSLGNPPLAVDADKAVRPMIVASCGVVVRTPRCRAQPVVRRGSLQDHGRLLVDAGFAQLSHRGDALRLT